MRVFTLLILLFFIPITSYSISNQDLMDKLDDMEFDSRHQRIMKEFDYEIRQQQRMLDKEIKELKNNQSNDSSKNTTGKYHYIVKGNSDNDFLIDKNSIKTDKQGTIYFIMTDMSTSPRRKDDFIYFSSDISVGINCQKNEVKFLKGFYYSSDVKLVKSLVFENIFKPISPNTFIPNFKNYLCN